MAVAPGFTRFTFGPAPGGPAQTPTLREGQREDWRDVHRIADAHRGPLARALTRAWDDARNTISTQAIADAIHQHGSIEGAIDWVALATAMKGAIVEAGGAVARETALVLLPSFKDQYLAARPSRLASEVFDGPVVRDVWSDMAFALRNKASEEFLKLYLPSLITRMTVETQGAVRDVVLNGFKNGVEPYYMAKQIRSMVGLTGPQVVSYNNRETSLLSSGVDPSRVSTMMDRWTTHAIKYRSEVIARTETIRAANAGQLEMWDEAAKGGLLDRTQTNEVWIATPDDRECQYCAELAGSLVPLGGTFSSPIGSTDIPPVHASCRCTLALDFSSVAEATPAQIDGSVNEIAPVTPGELPSPEELVGRVFDPDFGGYEDVNSPRGQELVAQGARVVPYPEGVSAPELTDEAPGYGDISGTQWYNTIDRWVSEGATSASNDPALDLALQYGLTDAEGDGMAKAGMDWNYDPQTDGGAMLYKAAIDVFGAEPNQWVLDLIDKYNTGTEFRGRITFQDAKNLLELSRQQMEKVLGPRAMTGTIKLYRGYQPSEDDDYKVGQKVQISGNALSSWTTDQQEAHDYGSVVFEMDVKLKDIAGFPGTGLGNAQSNEVVVYSRPGQNATVVK